MSYFITEECNKLYKCQSMIGNYYYETWYYDSANSIRHRIDGPAFIKMGLSLPGSKDDIYQEWWYMGAPIRCTSQIQFEKILKLRAFW